MISNGSIQSSPPSFPNHLSSADREEITVFIQSKSQIEQFIELISQKQDPFEGFCRLEKDAENNVEIINRHWSNLSDRIKEAQVLQDELDSIQTAVSALENNDMDRLRTLTKASLKREMSPHDTDLIEIAVQTIVAMESLLRMLIKRQEYASILLARLIWESKVRDCWNVYVPLKRDMNALINLSGRWKALQGNDDPAKTPKAAFLLTEVELLAGRSKAFIVDQIGTTSKSLDELIELRRVPDSLLDEQDRLEDLAETVKGKLVHIARLSMQWRWTKKPDQLYDLLDKLKLKAESVGIVTTKSSSSGVEVKTASPTEVGGQNDFRSEAGDIAPHNDNGNLENLIVQRTEDIDPLERSGVETQDDLQPDLQSSLRDYNVTRAQLKEKGEGIDEGITCLDIDDEQETVDVPSTLDRSSSPYSQMDVAMPFPSSTSTMSGKEDRLSDGSSLPSLSSTESLGDVFLVPGTPPSARGIIPDNRKKLIGNPVDRKSSERIQKKREGRSSRRVVSEGSSLRQNDEKSTPSKIPIPSTPRSGSRTPTSSARSMGRRTPSSRNVVTPSDSARLASTPTSIPRRIRHTSTMSSTSTGLPNKYKANPKSKLDVEVGKIVNKMSIPIRITHAANVNRTSSDNSEASFSLRERQEEWNDESGRYWVGYPDPKLCFCRILRSQRVMIRVGGGWEELSSYIFKHFGHLANPDDGDKSISKSNTPRHSPNIRKISNTFDGLPWISSKHSANTDERSKTPKDSPESTFVRNVSTKEDEKEVLRLASLPSSYDFPEHMLSSSSTEKSITADTSGEINLSPESMRTLWIRKEKDQKTPQKAFPQDFPFLQTTPTRWPSGGGGGKFVQQKRSGTPTKRARAISSVK